MQIFILKIITNSSDIKLLKRNINTSKVSIKLMRYLVKRKNFFN